MLRFYFGIVLIALGWSCNDSTINVDKVYLRLATDVARINPLISGEAYARQIEELIYQPLYQFDNDGAKLIPVLAVGKPERLEGEKGISFAFKIKEDALWSDGSPVTGYDYQFTMHQIFNPHLPTGGFRAYLHFLDSVEVNIKRPTEFIVHTNAPYFLAETVLSNIELFPSHYHDPQSLMKQYSIYQLRNFSKENAPAELLKLADDFINKSEQGNLMGSGPYNLESWQRGENVLLRKKENYWGNKYQPTWLMRGASEWIDFRIITEFQSAWQSMLSGELDVLNEVSDDLFIKECNSSTSMVNCFSPDQYLYYYIGMNRAHPALATPALRRAVAQCLDVDRWLNEQMAGLAVRVHNPISPMKSYYLADESGPEYAPQAAARTFANAGWTALNSQGIRQNGAAGEANLLRLRYSYVLANEQAKKLGLFFKELAAPAGLEIVMDPLDFSTLRRRLRSGDFDLYYLANYDAPADLDPRQRWHTEAKTGRNYFGFGDAASDQLIEEIGRTLEAAEREELYKKFQRMILDDQPCLFLFSPKQKIFARKKVKLQESGLWPGFKAQSVQLLDE